MENVNKNKETDFIQNILFCYKYVSSHYIFFFMPLDDRLDQQIQRDCDQTIFKHLEMTLEQRQFFKVFLVVRVNHVLSGSVVSDSLQLHGLQPARLLCPWGFSREEYWNGLPCPPGQSAIPQHKIKFKRKKRQFLRYLIFFVYFYKVFLA